MARKLICWIVPIVILLTLYPAPLALAQDDGAITLVPFSDHVLGISGIAPEGWLNIEPGFYYRDHPSRDPTRLGYRVLSGVTALQAIRQLAEAVDQDRLPENAGTYQAAFATWTLYEASHRVNQQPVTSALAVTETPSAVYVVALRAKPDEFDALYDSVFLPAVEAVQAADLFNAQTGVRAVSYWPTGGWQTTTPEAQGIDSAALTDMFQAIQEEGYSITSVAMVRHGYLVLDAYFAPFEPGQKHEMYSVTKSFTSALVGIALAEGYLESVDQRVLDLFPDREFENLDIRKRGITLDDMLRMRTGLDWNESGGYSYGENDLMQMIYSENDWVQYLLDRPMDVRPGLVFNYNSAVSHVLSVIVEDATGQTTFEYAQPRLFEPLGISNVRWETDPLGHSIGGWGLNLTPPDMAKFGFLYLHDGEWDGQQIVPAEWVQRSTKDPIANTYGYQWWIGDDSFSAQGLYGQRICVFPAYDLIVVFTAELAENDWYVEDLLLTQYIMPSLQGTDALPENPDAAARLTAEVEAAAER